MDFLARHPESGEELIQVCANLRSKETRTRESRALTEAAKEHRHARRTLLVLDRDAVAGMKEPHLQVEPAYEWLLAGSAQP